MKKPLILVAIILGIVGCFALYTSCKKNKPAVDNPVSVTQNPGTNKRSAGTQIYYSRDLETNVSYQLTIIKNADNEITIHREINTNAPGLDSMRTYYGFDEDVNYNVSPENVVGIDTPATGNTYLIPFKPDHVIENYIDGGENSVTEFYCTCDLIITNPASCQAEITKSRNGTISFFCTAKNCQSCKLHARKITKKKEKGNKLSIIKDLTTDDGFIVVNGNAIHEI